MNDYKVTNEQGEEISASFLGFFSVPGLEKEYAMYTINDDNPNSELGAILLGEVVKDNDNMQILGIEESEQAAVLAVYKDLSKQIGDEEDE